MKMQGAGAGQRAEIRNQKSENAPSGAGVTKCGYDTLMERCSRRGAYAIRAEDRGQMSEDRKAFTGLAKR